MKLSLWRPAPSTTITTPRLITGGVSLVLVVRTLIASAMFLRPAAAAPTQRQVALTNGTPRLEVLATWRERADRVQGHAIPSGHFRAKEAPEETYMALQKFLSG